VQVLLVVGGRVRNGCWQNGADPADLGPDDEPWTPDELAGGWYVLTDYSESMLAKPTHWMPLPDPPNKR